jgi:hypothetical protein
MDEIMTYRFTQLPFGLTCSPFLLSATLRKHADRHKATFPTVAPLIDSNTFMDDFAAREENNNGTVTIYYELIALMKLIKFPLAKWASSSEQLEAIWRAEGQEIDAQTQVLGVNWSTETDCFSVDDEVITKRLPEGPTTKSSSCKPRLGFTIHSGCTLLCLSLGNCYSRTHGAGGLTGMNSCLLTTERGGMLGYRP